MKKNILVTIITAILAAILGLSSQLVEPIVEKTYCIIKPSECSQPTSSDELELEE